MLRLLEKPDACLFLKGRTDEVQTLAAKLFECRHNSMVPDAAVLSSWDEVAFHHTMKPCDAFISVVSKIAAWPTHADGQIVTGNEEADVAQAVVNSRRKVGLKLSLGKNVVAVPHI